MFKINDPSMSAAYEYIYIHCPLVIYCQKLLLKKRYLLLAITRATVTEIEIGWGGGIKKSERRANKNLVRRGRIDGFIFISQQKRGLEQEQPLRQA
jgi:hypothetical protein